MAAELSERWCQLCWIAGLTTASGWCTWKTCYTAYYTCFPEDSAQAGNREAITKDTKVMMIFTCLASVLFSVSKIIYLAAYMVYMHRLRWIKVDDGDDDWAAFRSVIPIYSTSVTFLFCAYLTLIIAVFYRYQSVFQKTGNGLSYNLIRFVFSYAAFSVILVIIVSSQRPYNFVIGSILLVFGLGLLLICGVIYASLSAWICHRFWQSMKTLTRRNSSAAMSSAMGNLALKVSILSVTALTSTVGLMSIYTLMLTVAFLVSDHSGAVVMYEILAWMANLDPLVSNFCLVCTMKSNHKYYRIVFGKLHDYWQDRLVIPGVSIHGSSVSMAET